MTEVSYSVLQPTLWGSSYTAAKQKDFYNGATLQIFATSLLLDSPACSVCHS